MMNAGTVWINNWAIAQDETEEATNRAGSKD
jgi:hypothetical protein